MARKVRDAVVVITGASSGIGRATALECCRRGATVVVSSRRRESLESLTDECNRSGGRAIAIQADVNDQESMERLAREAAVEFGRIDAWFNNAAVTIASRFEEAPPDVYRQVIETNLFGTINGTRAVLPYFREQGSGVLINHSSVLGTTGASHFSAYCASEFAIKGFTESLRQELRGSGIDVCLVLPAAIDTPLYQHAANYSGRKVKPVNPVYDASLAAKAVADLVERPRREAFVGSAGRMVRFMRNRAPHALTDRMIATQWESDHFMDQPADPDPGNVFEPDTELTQVSGGWETVPKPRRGSMVAGLALAAIPTAILWRRRTRERERERDSRDTSGITQLFRNGRVNGNGLRSRLEPVLAAIPRLSRRQR
jgi:NAD(P)-dependent dehydrogenase (short-subunit alcohol dehydrogenase family)